METGKTGKYFKYAIGEIVLVVIGILIALQINNWNEEKKGKIELNQYLSSLKDNINGDIKVLDSLINRREITVVNCKKERLNFLNKTFNFDDTVNSMSAYLDFYFKANTSGYDALKNSPYLGKINGTDLNNLIINYYEKVYQIDEAEKSYNEFLESLEVKQAYEFDRSLTMAYFFMNPKDFEATKSTKEDIIEIFRQSHNSTTFRNIVSQAATLEESIIVPYKKAQTVGIDIIAEIDKMINN